MSIILKDIDLPKDGEHIITLIKNNGVCSYFEQDEESGTCKIMKTTKALQIPTPHGRLIDESQIFCTTWDDEEEDDGYTTDAPTILEAEE